MSYSPLLAAPTGPANAWIVSPSTLSPPPATPTIDPYAAALATLGAGANQPTVVGLPQGLANYAPIMLTPLDIRERIFLEGWRP